jgi:transcriptional regulator with XRE-family HTH domain
MNLKQWRKANRYTLPAFQKLLFEIGNLEVTIRTLMNWEKGHSLPSLEKAEAVRKATGGKVRPESFVRTAPQAPQA